MTSALKTYRLSLAAEADLGDIFDYTAEQFGADQAASYLAGLEVQLIQLTANPKLGRERKEIRAGLRSIAYTSHVIFYRIRTDHIRVVRILHGSRDLPRFF